MAFYHILLCECVCVCACRRIRRWGQKNTWSPRRLERKRVYSLGKYADLWESWRLESWLNLGAWAFLWFGQQPEEGQEEEWQALHSRSCQLGKVLPCWLERQLIWTFSWDSCSKEKHNCSEKLSHAIFISYFLFMIVLKSQCGILFMHLVDLDTKSVIPSSLPYFGHQESKCLKIMQNLADCIAVFPLGLYFPSHIYFPWLCLLITFSNFIVLCTFLEVASSPSWNE